jgi:hypothetical protein
LDGHSSAEALLPPGEAVFPPAEASSAPAGSSSALAGTSSALAGTSLALAETSLALAKMPGLLVPTLAETTETHLKPRLEASIPSLPGAKPGVTAHSLGGAVPSEAKTVAI